MHVARLDDEVFDDFVHRRAQMDVGVRVGRAVVHDELLSAGARLANQIVEIACPSIFSDARVRSAPGSPFAKTRSWAG